MRTIPAVVSLYMVVQSMLLGDIGRQAGGTFAQHRPHIVMCQSDFRSAVIRLFSMNRQATEYLYVQVIATIARGKSREYRQGGKKTSMLFIIFHQSFHWVSLKVE